MSFWHGVRDWNSGFGTIYLLGTQDARAIKALRHSRHLRTRALEALKHSERTWAFGHSKHVI